MTDYSLNRYLMQGTSTSRASYTPSPATVGSGQPLTPMWFETDTGYLWSWNQTTSAWVKVSGSGGGSGGATFVPPVLSAFTGTNTPSGATATSETWGVQMYSPSLGGAFNLNLYTENIPSTPYTQWLGLSVLTGQGSLLSNAGLALIDGTGKAVTYDFFQNGQGSGVGFCSVENYSSYSARSSYTAYLPGSITINPPYMGVYDNGTNLAFMCSYDGVSSFTVLTVSRTSYLTSGPTKIGFFTNGYSQAITANFTHWSSTLPGPT